MWAVVSLDDYSPIVLALFTTRADARAAHAAGMGDDVEAYPLYGAGVLPQRVTHWNAKIFHKDGSMRVWSYDRWDCEGLPPVPVSVRGEMDFLFAHGTTREEVVKAATEVYGKPVQYAG